MAEMPCQPILHGQMTKDWLRCCVNPSFTDRKPRTMAEMSCRPILNRQTTKDWLRCCVNPSFTDRQLRTMAEMPCWPILNRQTIKDNGSDAMLTYPSWTDNQGQWLTCHVALSLTDQQPRTMAGMPCQPFLNWPTTKDNGWDAVSTLP